MSYVLRANTNNGIYYYMNILCITQQEENAKHYASEEEAQKDAKHFENLFYYEKITPEIVGTK